MSQYKPASDVSNYVKHQNTLYASRKIRELCLYVPTVYILPVNTAHFTEGAGPCNKHAISTSPDMPPVVVDKPHAVMYMKLITPVTSHANSMARWNQLSRSTCER